MKKNNLEQMKTNDYFFKDLFYPLRTIFTSLLIILYAIFELIPPSILLIIIIPVLIIVCQRNNIYTFNKYDFKIHYPRRILGWKTKKILYADISEMIFKIVPRGGEGHLILIRTVRNEKLTLFYSSFMKKDEREVLIQEFKKRVGNDKVLSEFI